MSKSSAKPSAKKSAGKTSAKTPAARSTVKPAAVALRAIKGGRPAPKSAIKLAAKPAEKAKPAGRIIPTAAAPDDVPVIALNLPAVKLSPAMSAYFKKCEQKLGFVPNVLLAYAFDNAKLESFAALYNNLMLGESGLSKLEREMIAVAVSS